MGIDTWAVDFVLLDKDDKILGTIDIVTIEQMVWMKKFTRLFLKKTYMLEQNPKQLFNTIYQLWQSKQSIHNI